MIDTRAGPLLAIDTSTGTGSVAVGDGNRIFAEVVLGVAGQHSASLMPAVDAALRWAGATRSDLAGIVVAGGPGSFTGLRIGAATAKGIVQALELPLWSYSGLLAAAAGVACATGGEPRTVCAMFDARRREVFTAAYRFHSRSGGWEVEEFLPPQVMEIEALVARFVGEPTVFTGDGSIAYHSDVARLENASIAPPHLVQPRASSLLWLTGLIPDVGRVVDPGAWEPEYLRASGAERIAARTAGGDP